jgi:hypothetical protein
MLHGTLAISGPDGGRDCSETSMISCHYWKNETDCAATWIAKLLHVLEYRQMVKSYNETGWQSGKYHLLWEDEVHFGVCYSINFVYQYCRTRWARYMAHYR